MESPPKKPFRWKHMVKASSKGFIFLDDYLTFQVAL
jgi:hypothetical protein